MGVEITTTLAVAALQDSCDAERACRHRGPAARLGGSETTATGCVAASLTVICWKLARPASVASLASLIKRVCSPAQQNDWRWPMARARTKTNTTGEFKCPECGRTFTRAAALGAHRRQAHGVVGAATRSRSSRPRAARTTPAAKSSTPSTTTPRRRPNRPASNSSRARTSRDRSVDRDALLQALFPNGIPAKEDVIRAVNSWLDDAEQLAKMT